MSNNKKTRSRGWAFTLNNYSKEDVTYLKNNKIPCQYLCFGKEVGEKGTKHLQGYMYFEEKVSFKKVKKLINHAHWEPARSSPQSNKKYCSKEGDFYEYGEFPHQGKRNDLEIIKTMLDKRQEKEVRRNYFPQWCQYRRAFDQYRKLEYNNYGTTVKYHDTYDEAMNDLTWEQKQNAYVDKFHNLDSGPWIEDVKTVIVDGKHIIHDMYKAGVPLLISNHRVTPDLLVFYNCIPKKML